MKKALTITAAALLISNAAPSWALNPAGTFDLRSMPGFRLIEPSYRPSAEGMNVSVSLCRVIGWAASSPTSVHFRRAGIADDKLGHHDVHIARLGLRGGENCQRVGTHFAGSPKPDEKITICLAYSHRRCE